MHNNLTICGHVQNEELNTQIERFWRVEDMPNIRLLSKKESRYEISRTEHNRTIDGRFEVSLPFREDPSNLGESKASALKRLYSLERRFWRDPELQARYASFMDEYIKLGHMSALSDTKNVKINYLSHHAMIKEASTSTKLRVVFDASSSITSGKSLNDCLIIGSTIQSKLIDILIRFWQHPHRRHLIVYTSWRLIVKMYKQVMIKPEHRLYQCILWRTDPNEPATIFSLNTVTYGVPSASFLSIRLLQQLSFDFEQTHAAITARDFYVDDMITRDSTPHRNKNPGSNILKTAGFQLTKFHSNASLGRDEDSNGYGLTNTKILGLLWQVISDVLRYEANCNCVSGMLSSGRCYQWLLKYFIHWNWLDQSSLRPRSYYNHFGNWSWIEILLCLKRSELYDWRIINNYRFLIR